MPDDFREDAPDASKQQGSEQQQDSPKSEREGGLLSRALNNLLDMGLGESLLRGGTNLFSVLALVIVIWLAQMFYHRVPHPSLVTGAQAQGPAATAAVDLESMLASESPVMIGIPRTAQLHTNVPSRPRKEIEKYTVVEGDTVSGIAEKYGLQPETIFSANFAVLQDDPHNLFAGQVLQIMPTDGVYWEWLGGISFGAWADYFQVKPEDIINHPANHLNPAEVGDPANANIPTGTWLFIPGGKYSYHQPGEVPLGITRTNPASAQVAGAGACPPVNGGAVGTATFIFPTDRHYLSGFDYTPKTNHLGIDLAGNLGDNVYAADGGVVVYSGANNYGYGNMIMIDHGTGFQTLYAHLSQIFVNCGENVSQGQTIGAIGSTGHASGPHLHFEVRTPSTVINPWDVLPPREAAP